MLFNNLLRRIRSMVQKPSCTAPRTFKTLQGIEALEPRLTLTGDGLPLTALDPSDYLAGVATMQAAALASGGEVIPALTTASSPSSYLTPTGTPLDGVVKLDILHLSGSYTATGTLLPTGRHILTAAHVLYDPVNGTPALDLNVAFSVSSGPLTINWNGATVKSGFNGNLLAGNDIAIIYLDSDAPQDAARFDIYRASSEVGQIVEKVGYGRTGTGSQGSVSPQGDKRDGENRYDAFGGALNGTVFAPGSLPPASHLVFDFDNGNSTNDANGLLLSVPNLGQGTSEVFTAQGDSGGPGFLDGKIAGVSSAFTGFTNTPDSLPGSNSSFGEIALDTRVSAYAAFVNQYTDEAGVPKVTNVTISMSDETPGHGPFSFNNPSDDANDFDGSGIQLRTVPVGGADTVSIQFSEHVLNVTEGSLTLTGLAFGTIPVLASGGFSYDVGSHVATWRFSAPLPADQYLINLSDAVTDVAANALDGEWTNPFSLTTTTATSVFPSGDNTAGGDFNFVFTILPGDHDLDNDTDGAGFLEWQRMLGGPGHTFQQADFNGDGYTNGADLTIWSANFGIQLRDLVFADFNGSGVVNNADYAIWDANDGATGATHAQGDADRDGDVDADDFDVWDRQQGLELDWVA